MVKYLKLLLWPFSQLYGGIMALRNYSYDKGLKRSHGFKLPVIAVGNLTVGGTGKTPHVEYLLRLLQQYKAATLSRGYMRKSKGYLLADENSTAEELGDEPFQYHQDFPGVAVAVSEKRVQGIERLLEQVPDLDLIVLDDAMQHRAVSASLNIMLTDYKRLFYQDFVLPAGLLREPKQGAARADIVIVSKCPADLPEEERDSIKHNIRKFTGPDKPIFFSTIRYGQPVPMGASRSLTHPVVLLAGIANPKPLKTYLQQQYKVVREFIFPDHQQYTEQDLLKVKAFIEMHKSNEISILTTRKDAVKLTDGKLLDISRNLPLFYLPIEISFLEEGATFDKLILQHVRDMPQQIHPNKPQ